MPLAKLIVLPSVKVACGPVDVIRTDATCPEVEPSDEVTVLPIIEPACEIAV